MDSELLDQLSDPMDCLIYCVMKSRVIFRHIVTPPELATAPVVEYVAIGDYRCSL